MCTLYLCRLKKLSLILKIIWSRFALTVIFELQSFPLLSCYSDNHENTYLNYVTKYLRLMKQYFLHWAQSTASSHIKLLLRTQIMGWLRGLNTYVTGNSWSIYAFMNNGGNGKQVLLKKPNHMSLSPSQI